VRELLRRRIILGAALTFTLWAVWQVNRQDDPGRLSKSTGGASKHAAPTRQPSSTPVVSGDLNLPERPGSSSPVRDIFELPKPTAPLRAAVPNGAPVAPPLQYVYLGRIEEGGQPQIFLGDGDKPFVAKIGARLPNGWTLESKEAGRLNFSYEPLGQKQTLHIGDY